MKRKKCTLEDAVFELSAALLHYMDKDGHISDFQLMRDKCDPSTQFLYAKLIVSQMTWKGLSQENAHILLPRIKDTLLQYLQFQGLDDVIDDMCERSLEMLDGNVGYSSIYPDEKLNIQFATELLTHFILLNEYDAISRSFLIRVTSCLSIPYSTFLSLERSLLAYLSIASSRKGKDIWEIEEDAKKVSIKGKWWKIGAAAVAGSLVVFAAPVLLPAAGAFLQTLSGVATMIGGGTMIATTLVNALSATSAFLASSTGLTVFSAGLAAGGAGYAGNKMERRLNSEVDASIIDMNELKESPNTSECEAYDVMFVNGFLSANETAIQCWGFHPSNPWMNHSFDGGHGYIVDWESENLTYLSTMIVDTAIQSLSSSLLSRYANALLLQGKFVFTGALFVLYPISLLDNVWSVTRKKAEVLGTVLADQFLEAKDKRPMNLVAYSTGCIVVLSILKRLVEMNRIGLIQDVILLGCPAPTNKELWTSLRQVVSGRFVNGYSNNDGILCYLHRIESGVISVAGLRAIEVDGVENVDLCHLVKSHFDYKKELRSILQYVRFNSNE